MNGNQLIPFTYNSYKNTPIYAVDFYGDYIFAGVSNSGLIIRSKNRYSWETFYQTSDTNISALKVANGYLYIGTSPEGNIYRIKLSTMEVESFDSLGSEIVDFALFNGTLYAAVNGSPNIMKLNTLTNQWDFVYTPYGPINEMIVVNTNLYVVLEKSNIVYYDGIHWNKIIMNDAFTNFSSYRNVISSSNVFSSNNISNISTISNMDDEDVLSIFPVNKTNGIKCISQDGNSLVTGASNFTRFYRFLNGNIDMIFDTEGSSIDSILNINVGINLISSANKAYLVYSGIVSNQGIIAPIITTSTVTPVENPDANKVVIITYPNGGDNIQLGDTVNIQWSSTRSINDAVKIELIKGSTVNLVINGQTSNMGTYLWDVPLSLAVGNDYKIRITWLVAGSTDVNNVDESNDFFNILQTIPTTTTTTTTLPNPQNPSTASTCGIPILVLPEYESITKIVKDDVINSILFTTSNGRILSCDILTINGYMTGDRKVYADVYDGCGYIGSAQTIYTYALYKKLIELDENKVIQKWRFDTDITAIKTEKIIAVFQGPVINVVNDFGFWKELTWEEIKPLGSNITIYLRSSQTSQQLLSQPWIYSTSSENGESGTITRSLNNVGLQGQFLQIRIEMEVNIKDVIPSITNVTLTYSARNSSYFFTNKFSLDSENPSKKGLLTATISQPNNTEIQFGVSSENTANWNEYQVITPGKIFDMNNEEIKIGIKFTSYDDSLPEVSEFAIIAGGEVLKSLNN